jgi:mitogen-activated protein kinase kinase kinase
MASQSFASPTESEFSDDDGPDSVKNWDEDQVCDYLRSVKCGDYERLFRKNHINGENLLEMDKEVLKEMGIDKVGDRVRLFLSIKKLRTKAYANQKKRNRVRHTSVHSAETIVTNLQRYVGFLCRPR